MKNLAIIFSGLFLGTVIGCAAEVSTTDDSARLEVETPKLEVGEEPVDLNPATDGDIDVDSPLPGDS